jgi:hypothetical protein
MQRCDNLETVPTPQLAVGLAANVRCNQETSNDQLRSDGRRSFRIFAV